MVNIYRDSSGFLETAYAAVFFSGKFCTKSNDSKGKTHRFPVNNSGSCLCAFYLKVFGVDCVKSSRWNIWWENLLKKLDRCWSSSSHTNWFIQSQTAMHILLLTHKKGRMQVHKEITSDHNCTSYVLYIVLDICEYKIGGEWFSLMKFLIRYK